MTHTVTFSGEVSDEDFALLLSAGRSRYGTDKTDEEVLAAIRAEAARWLETYPIRAVQRKPIRQLMRPSPSTLDGKTVASITVTKA